MHDHDTRNAALLLAAKGHSARQIAKALQISRHAVSDILKAGTAEVPKTVRPSSLESHREALTELYRLCRGNQVRVHEVFGERCGVEVSYQTLTRFIRQAGIGKPPKPPVGEYAFGPGEEMQHDTSPHRVVLGGTERLLQCASVVLCFSRMMYVQVFERFTRLEARIFMTEAMQYFGGAAHRCVVDNTSVIRQTGTGARMVPAPEMAALGERFGFGWLAHELEDPDRKGRVERPFHFIEHNFYPSRTFADMGDCNRQLRQWCDDKNAQHRRHLRCRPLDLFATEQAYLKPLPVHVPEPYALHLRQVDESAYVSLHTNRYSVPAAMVGRAVEVRECKSQVRIFEGPRLVAEHALLPFGRGLKSRIEAHHRPAMTRKVQREAPSEAEVRLRKEGAELATYIDGLRRSRPGRAVPALKQLQRMWDEYPHAGMLAAVRTATRFGLYDLRRLERMVLRQVGGDLFGLSLPGVFDEPTTAQGEPDDD